MLTKNEQDFLKLLRTLPTVCFIVSFIFLMVGFLVPLFMVNKMAPKVYSAICVRDSKIETIEATTDLEKKLKDYLIADTEIFKELQGSLATMFIKAFFNPFFYSSNISYFFRSGVSKK